jgi:hypothetical protein
MLWKLYFKGYKPPRFPYDEIAQLDANYGGLYYGALEAIGIFCGTIKAILPCLICCIKYPYA